MPDTLINVSNDLADTVAAADRGVLRVDGRHRVAATGVAWTADGVIVTASHVLERDDSIEVGLPDGESVTATLVGRDPTTDLAVLRVEGDGLAPLVRSDLDDTRVGNLVLALGRPGKTVMATLGIVSAIGDAWRTRAGGSIDRYLQPDVAMPPGFSGGPLVDSAGKLLGLTSSGLVRGIAVAVPVATLERVVETLLQHGHIRRGYLGVGAQIARLPDDLAKELDQETGLLIVSVASGSPAGKAGLVLGDSLVTLDGIPVRQLDDLLGALAGEAVGKTMDAKIVRGGALQQVAISIGDRPTGA
jgi:S1-C subfamily serine protease